MDLTIESLSKKDASKIAEWKSDKELSKLIMSNYSKVSVEEAEEWIERNTSDKNQRLFGVFIKKNNTQKEAIGISRLMFIDFDAKTCELGMYIGNQNYRGYGLGKKALKLTLDFAFKNMRMNKVYLKVREDNIGAVKLYKKVGFKQEGVLREHFNENDSFDNNNILLMALFNKR